MKRTDITALFPDATDEQIDAIMNINGADINKAKGDTASLQRQLSEAQGQLAALQQGGGQPDQLAAANKTIETLRAQVKSLQDAEGVRQVREKVAADKKVPANLLTGDTEEACAAQADSILAFAQSGSYPALKDGGEITRGHQGGDKLTEGFAKLSADLFGGES